MYPRVSYKMSDNDLEEIKKACAPTPCMMIGGYAPSTPQENANRAWAKLGKKMGFDSDTVQPITGQDTKCFTAVPTETESQRDERLANEAEKDRLRDIGALKVDIADKEKQLKELEVRP